MKILSEIYIKAWYMKKIIYLILTALLFVEIISCSNDEDDSLNNSKKENETIENYSVGTKLVFDGVEHIVVRNTVSSENRSARVVTDEKVDPNETFQDFRSKYLKKETGIDIDEGYIELFDLTCVKEGSINDIPSLNDKYKILNANKEKIATVTLTRQSTTMFSNLTVAEKKEKFLKLSEPEIREYAPNYLSIDTTSVFYGENIDRKIKCELRFNYSDDTMKTLGDMNRKYYSKDFLQVGNNLRQVRNEYEYYGDNKHLETHLCGVLSSRFTRLADYSSTNGKYKLTSCGEGTINGKTSDSVYRCDVEIKSLTHSSSDIRMKVTKNDEVTESYSYENILSASPVLKNRNESGNPRITEGVSEIVSKYISFSTEKVVYNEIEIPKTVTFIAPYEDANAVYNKYSKIAFNWDSENSSYKVDKESFINNYKSDFVDLYNSVQ